jgi:hypothetical protein
VERLQAFRQTGQDSKGAQGSACHTFLISNGQKTSSTVPGAEWLQIQAVKSVLTYAARRDFQLRQTHLTTGTRYNKDEA